MHSDFWLSWSLAIILLAITSCATSPEAKFYMLNAIGRDTLSTSAANSEHNVAVKVGPVYIPDTLNQSQIVTRSGSNMLVLDEFNRWGGDFQDDIQRIMGENISILLPTNRVILYQDVSFLPAVFQVLVNIREFDGELGGMVTLNADWVLVHHPRKEKVLTARKSILQESTDGADYQAYVAAQSRLLAKLSQEIANEIRVQLGK
jgi:uncharacterized lipoprotein YmbA